MRFLIIALTAWLGLESPVFADTSAEERCDADCMAVDEGYDWALANGIASEFECDGNSPLFIDGCREYIDDSRPATSSRHGSKFDDEE